MNNFWLIVTTFGDSGFLLPAAFWIAVWLASNPDTRTAALHWVLLFGGCGLVVMISKLAFLGWGVGSARLDFTGFSGHTALATGLWPVIFWLAAQRASPVVRFAAVAAGCAWAVAVGTSRLALEAHSTAEVVTGTFLGLTASLGFLWLHRARPIPAPASRWLAAGLAVPLVFFLVGRPAPTQGMLEAVATWMAGIERPYTRLDLRQLRPPPRKRT